MQPNMLEIAAYGRLHVRRITLNQPAAARTTLLYASDLHLTRWHKRIVDQLLAVAREVKPNGILLGGDMVDHLNGLPLLTDCIRQLNQMCPVYAVPGNHDAYVGVDAVRAALLDAGGFWLPDTSIQLQHGTDTIRLDGICRHTSQSGYRILCAHDPAIFPEAVRAGYQLVLAGHLHGSQFVLARYHGRLYPGAWFFQWNGDEFRCGATTLLVSRGMNDTLPIRWNCPREVIVCHL
jgi:uncharacterized protein